MTPEQIEKLKAAAQAADQDGQHIYTNPRDSNNWRNNDAFNAMGSPAVVLSLIAQVEAQATEREKLLNIIASAYQIVGKHDAPARVLDVLADPLAATEEQVEAMLPYQVEALSVPQVEMTATSGAELSAAVERIQRQNMQGMADCMDMVHRELIEAGIIDNGTPPMMITNAVCAYIARMRSSLSNSPEIKGIAQTGWKLVPVELTDDMLVAFAEVWYSKARAIDDCEMADCYAAMLAAAPTIPAIPGTKEGA